MAISTAVPASAVARVLGIKEEFVNRRPGGTQVLPQRVALIGQGATSSTYPTTKFTALSAQQVGETVGYGTPLHLAAEKLLPANGDGLNAIPLTVYPLVDDGAGVAAAGTIIPVGAQTEASGYAVRVGNITSQAFLISVGDSVAVVCAAITAAVNATLNMPVIATNNTTDVGLVAKWEGSSANGIFTEIVGTSSWGYTFTITQLAGGATNPNVQPALDQIGDVWETMVISCFETGDTTNLNRFATWGEGRWGALTRKPAVVFWGSSEDDPDTLTIVPEGRKSDRINCQIPAPSCNDPIFSIAARAVSRIASLANQDPAYDYGRQRLDQLTAGPDGDQWDYAERDFIVTGGSSTTTKENGIINLADTVTFYHPDGDPTPAYRYVVDIVRLQNIIFSFDIEFAQQEWDGAPLIPDNQPTTNPNAKSPKIAKAAAATIVDNLGLRAILSDPATSKANITAEIDPANSRRLNLCVPVSLSGNTNIISVDVKFGFFFGTPALVA